MNFNPNAAHMLITQRVQRVESDAANSQARLAYAKTIADVVRCADISVPAEVRFMRNSIRGLRSLEASAERRIEDIINDRLTQIADASTWADAKAERGRFIQECNVLRGKYSRQYGHADRESQRLVYAKQQKERRADEGAASPPAE